LAEHFEGKLNSSVGSCLKAAQELNDDQVDVLVHGSDSAVASQIAELKKYPGVSKIQVAKNDSLDNAYGQCVALIAQNLIEANGYDNVIAASSSFGKDVVPRIGGLMDLQAITDIIQIKDGGNQFVRPIYAGNALCTVSTSDKIKLMTVRGTNFEKVP